MPKAMTHAYFILDIYDKLDKTSQKKLQKHKEHLKTFSQGVDILYLYNILNFKKGKHIRTFADNFHRYNTEDFFINLIEYIKEHKLEKKPEVIAFLYGFISHYVLDITIHPYIYYKGGIYEKEKKSSYKYNGIHEEIEGYFDAYMIYTKEGIEPKKLKVHNFLYNANRLSNELVNMISYVFNKTYKEKNIGNIYIKCIRQAKAYTKILMYDPKGLKRRAYKLLDKITPKSIKRLEPVSYYVHHKKQQYYLNLDKNTWHHPIDENEIYEFSFIELYRIGIQKTIDIINKVNDIIYDKEDIKILDEVFSNLSYESGKPCEDRQKMIYFEF